MLMDEFLIIHRKEILATTNISKQNISQWINNQSYPNYFAILILIQFNKDFTKVLEEEARKFFCEE